MRVSSTKSKFKLGLATLGLMGALVASAPFVVASAETTPPQSASIVHHAGNTRWMEQDRCGLGVLAKRSEADLSLALSRRLLVLPL